MSDATEVRITLTQQQGYAFTVDFGDELPELMTDEPEPVGEGRGPNPSALLLASVANCLAASLTFALRKFKNEPGPLRVEIVGRMARNETGRWRIPEARVDIHLAESGDRHTHLERALEQFEDFCIVTQSVREGIAVDVAVRDAEGEMLKGAPA